MSCESLPALLHHALRKNQGQQQLRQAAQTSTLIGPCEARPSLGPKTRKPARGSRAMLNHVYLRSRVSMSGTTVESRLMAARGN